MPARTRQAIHAGRESYPRGSTCRIPCGKSRSRSARMSGYPDDPRSNRFGYVVQVGFQALCTTGMKLASMGVAPPRGSGATRMQEMPT